MIGYTNVFASGSQDDRISLLHVFRPLRIGCIKVLHVFADGVLARLDVACVHACDDGIRSRPFWLFHEFD